MDKFIFNGWHIGKKKNTAFFLYSLIHNDEHFEFTETLELPKSLSDEDVEKSKHALDFLALALGLSFWKTFCPKEIETPFISLSKDQAEFWNAVYTKGLGEFFYKNKIDFRGLVNFPTGKASPADTSANAPIPHRALVLLGGGKDSLVSAELLRKEGKEFSFFSLGEHPIFKETAKIAGADMITIKRTIDQKLFELNKRFDVYNGHVPVSLIYSGAGMLVAGLYGFDEVIISAERSANYGNVEYFGETINHQWSKSEEAETLIKKYFDKYVTGSIKYHSLIRDFSEIKIAEIFSHYPKYFDVFSSCNKNFLINKQAERKWCGECPKCAFVFAILAPFVPKSKLISIFGKNLFADKALLKTYRELLGVESVKPFECVGTPEETKLAFLLVYKKGEYKDDVAMNEFESRFKNEFSKIEQSQKLLLPKYEA